MPDVMTYSKSKREEEAEWEAMSGKPPRSAWEIVAWVFIGIMAFLLLPLLCALLGLKIPDQTCLVLI